MQELLDEGMIPWKGRLLFRTYNPAKIKYSLLIRMVWEQDGIFAIWKFTQVGGKKMEWLSLLGPYMELGHHIDQDNYYNSISIAETLLLQ